MKVKTVYVCSECAGESPRWYGKCPDCASWNTLTEQVLQTRTSSPGKSQIAMKPPLAQVLTLNTHIADNSEERGPTGLAELDRVLGGGVVKGSVILLSGDPGVGKSTLLLQACKTMCAASSVLYIAGEESPRQIGMRASRLGVSGEKLYIAPTTDIEEVVRSIHHTNPGAVMVDSIQTMRHMGLNSSTGSVTQVRECAGLLAHAAKSLEIPVFIVGHVNKDGGIAGPKVLEHMVDVVLYFEGERHSAYRILRAVKNRFGSTNEIGVFEMSEHGLADVENPSLAMLSGRPVNVSGTCVACVMEGTRPILAEAQALVSKSSLASPRRVATGFDYNRAALIIAILEKRAGYFFGNLDAFINIVGGLKLDEPAADLPVALALASNLIDRPLGDGTAAFGEIGLAGEVRSCAHAQSRVNECARLGFTTIILPRSCVSQNLIAPPDVRLRPVKNIAQAFDALGKH